MASNLFQQLNGQLNNIPTPTMNPQLMGAVQSAKRMLDMLNGRQDAMQILYSVAQQNPQLSNILSMLQNSGTSPKQLFMNYAQQLGVNPNDIINMLK